MAKRKRRGYYGNPRDERRRRRQRVLLALFSVVLIAVIWRVFGATSQPIFPDNPTDANPAENSSVPLQVRMGSPTTPETVPAVNSAPSPPVQLATTTEQPNPVDTSPETLPNPGLSLVDSRAMECYEQGKQAMVQKDYVLARDLLSKAVAAGLSPLQDNQARLLLNQASDQWLFSRRVFPNDPYCERYVVKSGEILSQIGPRYQIPYQLIMRINSITDARKVPAGQTLKIVQGPFHASVDRTRHIISVYLGDTLVRTWPVGLGAPGRETPIGKWLVEPGKKIVNPPWWDRETGKNYLPDDPENPLGERWIGLQGVDGDAIGRVGFGIHGTIKPDEIGKNISRGCIRLFNQDVEVLYDMLIEGKSIVWVRE